MSADNTVTPYPLTPQIIPGTPNYGAPGREQFADCHVQLRNIAIEAYVGVLFNFREEYIGDDGLATRNGFDDATLIHFNELVANVDEARRLITDNPAGTDLKDIRKLMVDVADTKKNVNDNPAAKVQVALSNTKKDAGPMRVLQYALDGSDPNIPLSSQLNIRNPLARTILSTIDAAIRAATRCEDRYLTSRITPQTSLMFYGYIEEMYVAIQNFGGAQNRLLVTSGTRRAEEPRGPQAAPNAVGEVATVKMAGQA